MDDNIKMQILADLCGKAHEDGLKAQDTTLKLIGEMFNKPGVLAVATSLCAFWLRHVASSVSADSDRLVDGRDPHPDDVLYAALLIATSINKSGDPTAMFKAATGRDLLVHDYYRQAKSF